MGTQPDRRPGPRLEEEIIFEADPVDPTEVGAFRFNGETFRLRDANGVFDPRTGGSGITEGQHETIDSLVHELAETSYTEVARTAGRVSSVAVWTDGTKTKKIRETTITRDAGRVSVVVEKQYDAAGTLKQTLTHTIARTGGRVSGVATAES
jgi:hypothetical protein